MALYVDAGYWDDDYINEGALPPIDDYRRSGGWLPKIYVDAHGNPVDLDTKVEAAIKAAPKAEQAAAKQANAVLDMGDARQIVADGMQAEARAMIAMVERIDAALAEWLRIEMAQAVQEQMDDDAAITLLLLA